MRRRAWIVAGVFAALLLIGAITLVSMLLYGFSAQDEPTAIERTAARAMRHWAAPSDLRGRRNPIPLAPGVLAEARAHFADHCAVCHGNDGKGEGGMGK
jgi:mono/diheme cytochrome c family protein